MTRRHARLCALAVFLLAGSVPAGGSPGGGVALLYNAGEAVDGLPLTAVLERDDTARYVSFVYGDCEASGDTGCAPPAEVQVWPACRRSLALYGASVPGGPAVEPATVRGVPAAFVDDDRLELQTGRVTIVIFAGSRARLLRIARALRAADGSVPDAVPLPAPVPGALEGRLEC